MQKCKSIRAFALGLANAKCKVNLAFEVQRSSTFGLPNGNNYKKFYNVVTIPFYM